MTASGGNSRHDSTIRFASWVTHRWAPWGVLIAVLFAAIWVGAGFGTKINEIEQNNVAAWLPADAESTKVIDAAKSFTDPNATPFIIVFVDENGIDVTDPSTAALIESVTSEVAKIPNVGSDLEGPIESTNGKAVQIIGTIVLDPAHAAQLPGTVNHIRSVSEKHAGQMTVYIGGPAAVSADQSKAFGGIGGKLMLAAVGVVVVLLLLMYRSPVLWILPLGSGLVSVYTAQGMVYLLAKYADLTVNGQSAGILPVLVLGASVDYALLIVARYREELHHVEDRREAMAHALHRAAPAIIASGSTVMVGLLCLSFAQLTSTAGLGPVGAAGIASALLVMLTLLPALLVIFGRWVFWPFIPTAGTPDGSGTGLWARVGTLLARRPRPVWIITSIVLAGCALGAFQLNATGLSTSESFTKPQPSVAAQEQLSTYFAAGEGSPLEVVANASHADEVATELSKVNNVTEVSVPTIHGDTAFITATLKAGPQSGAAEQAVRDARTKVHRIDGADALVGGATAVNLDVQDAAAADNRLIIPIVMLVVFVILSVLLRALVISAILLATVALSYFATLGIGAFTFRHIFDFAGTDAAFPLYAFVFLVALGIDYNIFLMTRVREETRRLGTRKGMLVALAATGGVITSAGLVLAGTFGTLAVLPIVFLTELGFVVAFGVVLDTIIVRSVLVTSIVLDAGKIIWWPSRLWRHDQQSTEITASD